MPGFFINGLDLPLGQGHIVISGVDKGIGTTIGVSGKFVDNTAPNPVTPITLYRNAFVDPSTACSLFSGPTFDAFISRGIVYTSEDLGAPFSGREAWYYTPSYSKFGPSAVQIGFDGALLQSSSCSG